MRPARRPRTGMTSANAIKRSVHEAILSGCVPHCFAPDGHAGKKLPPWACAYALRAYPRMRVDGRLEGVGRLAIMFKTGSLPTELVVRTCTTEMCIEHLALGSRGANGALIPCRKCGSTDREPPRNGTNLGNCRQCHNDAEKARYHADPIARRERDRERLYGIPAEVQWAFFDRQERRCGNKRCRNDITFRNAHVDHDHGCCPTLPACGKCVRGFLCGRCNDIAGKAKDDGDVLVGLGEYLYDWQIAKEPVTSRWTGSFGACCD